MKNFRKEQMKLAVLLEITDKGGKNGEIIKAAESRLILDDEYNRMMQNGKQTIGNKEMQFVLYYLKKDGIVDVPARGLYVSNELTLAARKMAIVDILAVVDDVASDKSQIILTDKTIQEIRIQLNDSTTCKEMKSENAEIIYAVPQQAETSKRAEKKKIQKDNNEKIDSSSPQVGDTDNCIKPKKS